jgi:hypothetical protein
MTAFLALLRLAIVLPRRVAKSFATASMAGDARSSPFAAPKSCARFLIAVTRSVCCAALAPAVPVKGTFSPVAWANFPMNVCGGFTSEVITRTPACFASSTMVGATLATVAAGETKPFGTSPANLAATFLQRKRAYR